MDSTENPAAEGIPLLIFMLGGSHFGVDASKVQEIAMPGGFAKVCNAPVYVLGIKNLRGRIATVIDLAARLGMAGSERQSGEDSRLLIVEWREEPIALLVDKVADIQNVDGQSLLPPPQDLHGIPASFIEGVQLRDGNLVAMLSLDSALVLPASSSNGEAAEA